MNKNICSYAKVFSNWINEEVCDYAVNELEKNTDSFTTHSYSSSVVHDKLTSYTNDLVVSYCNITYKQLIMSRIWDAIFAYFTYIKEEGIGDWFNAWSGFSEIRFNKYKPDTEMRMHCDHIHSLFDGHRKGVPILSIVGALNENYTGGDFILWGDTTIKLKTGDVIIFPSSFLYPHQVTPVTSDVRYSFVSWAY